MKFLALMTKTADGYAGLVPELTVLAVGDSPEEVQQALAQGVSLYLQDVPDARPLARHLAELPEDVQADYAGTDVQEVLLEPAPMNPVSLEVKRAIDASGLSYREVARRMGTGHAAISRMANPFYWGHSLPALHRLADVLGVQVQLKLSA